MTSGVGTKKIRVKRVKRVKRIKRVKIVKKVKKVKKTKSKENGTRKQKSFSNLIFLVISRL